MPKARRRRDPRPIPDSRVLFESAVDRPVTSPEVQAVIAALGGRYEVHPVAKGPARYDPDLDRTVTWDFPDAPPANRWNPTQLWVRDDTVVSLNLAPELVGRSGPWSVVLRADDDTRGVYRPQGAEWNWAPGIVQRRGRFLLDLDVGQGHWDGNYKFPLTPRQVERLQEDLRLYREVWDGLVRICQGRRFFDDPATLPGDAQALIDARCGQD